jgi:cardiolipin synthase
MSSVLTAAWLITWLAALATMPSVLLRREGNPLSALTWIIALFTLPPAALTAWWLFGRTHIERKVGRRRRATRHIAKKLQAAEPQARAWRPFIGMPPDGRLPPPLCDSAFRPSGGNRVEILPEPAAAYERWEQVIRDARDHLHMTFFIWTDDEVGRRFRGLLENKARERVEVRLIVDGVGSRSLPSDFFAELERRGGQVRRFMPPRLLGKIHLMNFRNHRKALVADGRIGFVGGINVTADCLEWSDLAVGIEGPGVDQIQEVFAEDWYYCADEELLGARYFGQWERGYTAACDGVDCATIGSGPDQPWNAIREMLFVTINACRRRLWIITPYLIPDSAIVLALRTAVYRGVDVRVVAPADSDNRLAKRASHSFYPQLLASGVQVLEHAGMVHAKAALLDDELALVSSANLDIRSARLNYEISTFLGSRALVAQLERFFEQRFARCRALSKEELAARGTAARVVDAAAHLLSPLL